MTVLTSAMAANFPKMSYQSSIIINEGISYSQARKWHGNDTCITRQLLMEKRTLIKTAKKDMYYDSCNFSFSNFLKAFNIAKRR